ncbi:hypothetical protein D9756_005466 [Leucocoprinus leucothites]|uniref:BZIP domain-containing protein n=1 Tax=Leucocoprinus leucothites TaxID=201217 RepID=A0A8H5D7C6_9AGAR|nr:hypothetical protein D9756_005466 [Leucoagaricus leucothites]
MSLSLNQILAHDAPLLSPVSPTMTDFAWDVPFYHHPMPSPAPSNPSTSSPVQPSRALKSRMSPEDALPDACVSTQQLFELTSPPSPALSQASVPSQPMAPAQQSHKRSASPTPAPVKKPRAQGERICSKDFIPPDVTGLTKREARLVKNRAAAFLSRQRKREEFETMEHRVAELESENARLLALTQTSQESTGPKALVSEVEQLKAELAAARNRERELSAQLASRASPSIQEPPVKLEASDSNSFLSSPARTSNMPSPNKAGASLGLMVLLCALPTLLSMPMHNAPNTSFTIPTPLPPSAASSFDLNSYLPTEYDWSRSTASSIMDLDTDHHQHHRKLSSTASASTTRRLEFSSDLDAETAGGLGNLDISFDASPSESGKIRVRIHNSASTASSRATSPGATSSSSSSWDSDGIIRNDGTYSVPSPSSISSTSSSVSTSAFSPIATSDPFFGIGGSNDFGLGLGLFGDSGNFGNWSPNSDDFSYSSLPSAVVTGSGGCSVTQEINTAAGFADLGNGEFAIPDPQAQGQKRRVRIALKSMPHAGGAEGGEWEVQIC